MCTEISQVDGNLDFIGNSSNEFVANLKLYKLTALNPGEKLTNLTDLPENVCRIFNHFLKRGKILNFT